MNSAEMNAARVQPEIETVWQWYDWERGVLTVQLSNGMDVELRVSCDVAQGSAFYDIDTDDKRPAARQWVALHESLIADLWDQERRKP